MDDFFEFGDIFQTSPPERPPRIKNFRHKALPPRLSTTMREPNLILVGLVAMCVVSAAALARLIGVVKIFRRQRGYYSAVENAGSSSINTSTNGSSLSPANAWSQDGVPASHLLLPSLVFHVLVFLCLAVEIPVYAFRLASTLHPFDDGEDFYGVGRPLYALHLSSYLLLFWGSCVIVTLWSDVAVFEPTVWTVLVNRLVIILCFCYLMVTGLAISVCAGLGGVKYFFTSFAFLLFCAYSIVVLLLLGLSFLVLGSLLQRRICRVLLTDSCSVGLTARVVRLNVIVLACFVCFCWRAYMLAALVEVQAEGEEERHFGRGWKRWEWDMRLEWALHVIPCVTMLYLMRRAGQPTSASARNSVGSGETREFGGVDVEDGGGQDAKGSWRTYGSSRNGPG